MAIDFVRRAVVKWEKWRHNNLDEIMKQFINQVRCGHLEMVLPIHLSKFLGISDATNPQSLGHEWQGFWSTLPFLF